MKTDEATMETTMRELLGTDGTWIGLACKVIAVPCALAGLLMACGAIAGGTGAPTWFAAGCSLGAAVLWWWMGTAVDLLAGILAALRQRGGAGCAARRAPERREAAEAYRLD